MNQATIGIVGGGVVGGAVKNFFHQAKVYDKYKKFDPLREVAKSRFIFICVPTPYAQGLDLSMTDDAIANVVNHLVDPSNQLIVIKSTVWPGTTQKYQDRYPETNFAFNPEFLRDRYANEDFLKNDRQIVGYTKKTKNSPLVSELLEILPKAPYQKILPAEVAEMIKYASNTYLATQVIFANQISDLCEIQGINYEEVKEPFLADKRVGKSHWEIWHTEASLINNRSEPYRGYGGKCLPKELNTLIDEGKKLGVDISFFEIAREINLKLNGGRYE